MCASVAHFFAPRLANIGIGVCYVTAVSAAFVPQYAAHYWTNGFMKKEHTSIRLDPAVLARLKDMAQERATTATALIDLAIGRFLADETIVGELRGMEERLAATIVRSW